MIQSSLQSKGKDALHNLDWIFGQPQYVLSAHLYKLYSFRRIKMQNSYKNINFSAASRVFPNKSDAIPI